MNQASACPNCGYDSPAAFCPACGQKQVHGLPSFRDIIHEVVGALFSYDAKLWRTLGILLSKPGQLTVDFTEGKRARYLQPLQLFIWLQAISFAAHQAFFDPRGNITHNKSLAVLLLGLIIAGGLWVSDFRRKNAFTLALVAGAHLWSFLMVILLVEYSLAIPVSKILVGAGWIPPNTPVGKDVTMVAILGFEPYLFLSARRVYGDRILLALVRTLFLTALGLGAMTLLRGYI